MTPALFNYSALRPGDIVHSYTTGLMSRQIVRVLGSVGSHDALVMDGLAGIGESLPLRARVTPFETYEKKMRGETCRVAILRCPQLTQVESWNVSAAWENNVCGTFYDFGAFPRLWFKARFADIWDRAAGWEWAHWCTEGLQKAYRLGTQGYVDPWGKNNPTPKTTENRLRAGVLVDVSDTCLTDEGQKYRLDLSKVFA
jgi:hypothetical protein